jgi:hypothetical protein
MTRRPLAVFPSLHRVLLGRVPRLPRYYEDAKPPCHPFRRASFPSLGDTRDVPRASLPSDPEVLAGRAWSLGSALPLPILSRETTGFPTFLRNPPVHLPCSPTPVGPTSLTLAATPTRPLRLPRQRLRQGNFRGSITRLLHSLSTLRRVCYRPTTQDSLRLPARLYRTGFKPAGSYERFLSVILHLFPLSQARPAWQAFRGARKLFHERAYRARGLARQLRNR